MINKRDILATSVRNVEELKRRYDLEREQETVKIDYPISVENGGTGSQTLTNGSYLIGNGINPIQSKTAQQVADDVRALVQPDLSGYAIKPVMLWENASPTSSFTGQTISLSDTSYDIIVIRFKWADDDNGGGAPLVCIKGAGQNGASSYENNRVQRYATYNSDGTVTFTGGLYNGSHNNNYCIPTHIWGI